MKSLESLLYFTNHQKILNYLLSRPEEKFYDRQISLLTGVSRAGTNFALRDLAETGVIGREKQGRMNYYHISLQSPLVKEMKIVMNLVALTTLVDVLKPLCRKVILFGSASKGTNTAVSDYDILAIANEKQRVSALVMQNTLREKLQVVVMNMNEYAALKVRNTVFYREIQNGMILWEKN